MKDMKTMFDGTNLSIANYDALLLGWSQQDLQNYVNFSAGNSQYSSRSKTARDKLTDDFNWIITDAGEAL